MAVRIKAVSKRLDACDRVGIGAARLAQQVLLKAIVPGVSHLLPLHGVERLAQCGSIGLRLGTSTLASRLYITGGSKLLGQAFQKLTSLSSGAVKLTDG
ncbi:hypothetical protein [Mesorhizobium amorphae]|uniref:hypothetical protein n=1 Tax=Mesorhizobium amorphae TaxID=71433 RepID=UPI0024E14E63|nr:hypothetical protein [Mesorhizobium amorphae]